MEFSKKYLLKYGWEEGQGLGKMNDGIKSAIKPKLKFDKAGMGYDPSTEFTDSWWIKVYNDALEDVNLKEENSAECERDEEEHTNKKKSKRKKKKCGEESFIDLFTACEGRTVHKGARQGLKLGGKLRRLEEQEFQLLLTKESKKIDAEECCPVKSSVIVSELLDEESEQSDKKKHKSNKKKHKSNKKKHKSNVKCQMLIRPGAHRRL